MLGRQFTLEKQSIHEMFVNTTAQHNTEMSFPFLNDTSAVSNSMEMGRGTLFRGNFLFNYRKNAEIPHSIWSVGQIDFVVNQDG